MSLEFFGFGFGNGNGKEKPTLTAPKFAVERDGMDGRGSFQGEGLVIWAGSGDSEKINKKINIFAFFCSRWSANPFAIEARPNST